MLQPLRPATEIALPPEAIGPASIIQEGLWIEAELGRAGDAYNEGVVLDVHGDLDPQRLHAALLRIVARHPALRTRFAPGADGLEQQVGPCLLPDLIVEGVADARSTAWLAALHSAAFDTAQAPLFRLGVARLGPARHRIAFVAHHLIVDGWSLGVFQRELSHFYTDPCATLPPVGLTPIDLARNQRSWLHSREAADCMAFWEHHLAGAVAVTDGPGGAPVTVPLALDGWLVGQVTHVARRVATSPFNLLFAAFAQAVQTLTGRDDIMLSTDFSARLNPQSERMIGMLVNQLPLRWTTPRSASASARLTAVRTLMIEVLTHGALPFPMIAKIGREGVAKRFEAKFVLHNMPTEPFRLADAQVTATSLESRHAKFPALVELWEDGVGLSGLVTIDRARSRLDATRLAATFVDLVQGLVAALDDTIQTREGVE